jgi:hypothetical protein
MSFTRAELEAMHEHTFQTAKESMLRDGKLLPIVFLAFDAPDPAAALQRVGLAPQGSLKVGIPVPGRAEPSVAVIPLLMTAREMVDILSRMIPGLAGKISLLRSVASTIPNPDGKDADELILRTFCAANGVHEKDVIARYLRWLARELDAYALLKVDEAWGAKLSKTAAERRLREGGPEVRHMLGRDEIVLVTMETRTIQGTKVAVVQRKVPGDESSPPVGFSHEETNYAAMGGRFFDLIEKAN